MPYALRLVEDTLAPGARYAPPRGSTAGVFYLAGGEMRAEGSAAAPSAAGRAPIARPGTIAGRQGARLLRGRLEVTVGDAPMRTMKPGDAWFESGREPVLAVAAADEDTSFIRVAVLPAEILGRSSIVYVDPAEATRSRPRTYTVFVDEPISL